MSRRKTTDDHRHHRKGLDNPSYQPDESHDIERLTSPKRNRKNRSSKFELHFE